MSHYKHNLRDLEFALFELLGRDQVLGTGPFEEVDGETARDMLAEVARLATEDLAPLPARLRPQPPGLRPGHALRAPARVVPPQLPGLRGCRVLARGPPRGARRHPPPAQPALGHRRARARQQPRRPHVQLRASPSPRSLHRLGTEDQKRLAGHMVENHWGATMVLTEPDAGSDVGAGRAKAVQQADGAWHIEGVKRFITSAEHDMQRQHRPPRAGPSRGRAARAPRACRCSSSRSTTSTSRPASSASATASSSPTSSTRWASRSPPPAS